MISKEIFSVFPVTPTPSFAVGNNRAAPPPALIARSGTIKVDSSLNDEEIGRVPGRDSKDPGQKNEFMPVKQDSADNQFIEDVRPFLVCARRFWLTPVQIISAISYHFGERLVRMRFTEYVTRFVRLSSRYEEEVTGKSEVGYTRSTFTEAHTQLGAGNQNAQLGSGIVFGDEATCMRELTANASRIEAWRKTSSYRYCAAVRVFLFFLCA